MLHPGHPEIAQVLNNLAGLYHAQGQYGKAEPLHRQAQAIMEEALGHEDSNVAESLNGRAELLRSKANTGRPTRSIGALGIWKKVLGPEHPDVATGLNNLAGLYITLGQYAKAEPLYDRALAIREKALGPEHPDLAKSLNNLAGLYRVQDQYGEADPLRSGAGDLGNLPGPGTSHRGAWLNNLGRLYEAQGQYAKAESLYERALAIKERSWARSTPTWHKPQRSGGALRVQGQYAKAEPLYDRALAIWETTLGPEHPNSGLP